MRAAAPGQVIYSGWDNWSGNTVIVSHDAGGGVDAYRTIYVHLRNGASNDADIAWNKTVPSLKQPELDNYKAHLNATGCTQIPANRKLLAANRGTNEVIVTMLLGKIVSAGQFLAWSGETRPGGNIAGDTSVNNHVYIFFAHREPTDKKWYFFDPYGIYATPDCYPSGLTDSLDTPRVRYPIAW